MNPPVPDSLFIKLAWLELSAHGTIAIGAVVLLAILLVGARLYAMKHRKT
jgi:hypothetical protein